MNHEIYERQPGELQLLTLSDLLVKNKGNQSETAKMLRINRSTLITYINQPSCMHIVIFDGVNYFIYTRRGYGV